MTTTSTVEEILAEIDRGDLHRIPELVEQDPAQLAARDESGRTLLHEAAWHGARHIARFLLDAGSEVDARDAGDLTPLHLACQNGHPAVVALLLDRGADIDARGAAGTPLYIAAPRGTDEHPAIVRALLARGADLDLDAAVWLESPDAIAARMDADPGILDRVAAPHRLLPDAVRRGSREIVELLLERGVDPDAPGSQVSPLFLASSAASSDIGIVRALLEHGADPNATDSWGRRLLAQIERVPRDDIKELLRRYGAEP